MIPKFTLRAQRGLDLPIHGDGLSVRSYLYVEDVADAYITVLLKGVVGETYNIGTQKERTVVDVARDICKLFNLPESKVVHVRDRAFNDRRWVLAVAAGAGAPAGQERGLGWSPDGWLTLTAVLRGTPFCRYFICDKKLLELGWSENTPWEVGLRKTVEWYLKNGTRDYWNHGDMELALEAHPTLQLASNPSLR